MRTYIVHRILLIIPVVVLVTIATFAMVRLIPGDIVDLKCGNRCSEADYDRLARQLGTDKPIVQQYWQWITAVIRGDFGTSLISSRPVVNELRERIPVTVELTVLSMAVALAVALPAGVVAAVRQDSLADYLLRLLSTLGLAIPGFWLATLVVTLPALWWGWSPLKWEYMPFTRGPVENIRSLIFPSLVLGVSLSAITMRLTRSALLEILRQDYIRTAWAKGLRERSVIMRHALKNALIPVVTVVGFQLAALLGGTVIIEQIFRLPGVGQSTLLAISQRDYPQLQANVLFLACAFLVVNLLVDLSYGVLDPRIRYR